MPHDRDGKPLSVGDTVYIPCKVLSLGEGEVECNATVEALHDGRGTSYKPTVTLNTAQLKKAEAGPAAEPPEPKA